MAATSSSHLPETLPRRAFFRYAGATALVLTACDTADDPAVSSIPNGNSTTTDGAISLGAGDVGLLNYAYVFKQLEADFYARAVATTGILSADEGLIFQQIATHEAIHRDFFKISLTRAASSQVLRTLTPQFAADAFATRASLLATAQKLEDLGVAAYNGAGPLFATANYLGVIGQLVSVEARHAAYIRSLVEPGSFAADGLIDANGLDHALTPTAALAIAQDFIMERLDGSLVGIH
jgi:hypothetical protein